LLKRYWIDGTEYRLRKTVFDDLYYQRSVAIEHSEFEEISGQFYPKKTVVKIKSEEGNAQFAFEITRLKLDKTNDFPFEIPDDYERRIHN
jgi:hypothetical protein